MIERIVGRQTCGSVVVVEAVEVKTVVTVVLAGVMVLVRVVVEVTLTVSDRVLEDVVVGTLPGFFVVMRVRQPVCE